MKKRLVVLGIVCLLTVGLVSSNSEALPPGGTGFEDIYYSDDTFTEVVGWRYMECQSTPSSWGVRTQYVQSSSWSCQPEPPNYYSCKRYICLGQDQWGNPIDCHEVVGGCL